MKKRYPFHAKNSLKKFILGLTATIVTSFSAQAQVAPAIIWDKTIGGTGGESPPFVALTEDGGYLLGGSSSSGQGHDKTENHWGWGDFWLVKLDSTGTRKWDKTFGRHDTDHLQYVKELPDGGFILAGTTTYGRDPEPGQPGKIFNNFWLIRLNKNGTKLWDKILGGDHFDDFRSLVTTRDGGFLLCGTSQSDISGDKSENNKGPEFSYDAWLIKTDAGGNKLWDKSFGGAGNEGFAAAAQTQDGGFIFGGSSNSDISPDKSQPTQGGMDFWILKTDSAGKKIWDKTIGGNGNDRLTAIQVTANGDFICGGSTESDISGDKRSAGKGGEDFWVVKVDQTGNVIWDKTFGGTGTDRLSSLEIMPDGGFVCVGESYAGHSDDKTGKSRGNNDMWVLRLNADGVKLWDKTMGGNGYDTPLSVKPTPDNGFVIGGSSNSLKSVDKSQNPKTQSDMYGQYDFWLVKLGPELIKEPIEAGLDFVIAPNPVTGRFNLHFSEVKLAVADVSIYNQLGREVFRQEIQVMKNKTSETLSFSAVGGIYFLQVRSGNHSLSKKFILK